VGRNGIVHVDAGSVKMTLAIGRALQRVDREGLGEDAQKRLVAEILKGV
jgi:exosome complex component RRP40